MPNSLFRNVKTTTTKIDLKITRRLFLTGIVSLVSISLLGCFASQKSTVIISASPSTAADGFVYFADAEGRIHALRSDGQPLWQYSLADDRARSQNGEIGEVRIEWLYARSGGKLYGLARVETGGKTGDMVLFALDGNQLRWFKDSPRPEPNGSPVAIGDRSIYLAANDGKLYAFDRDDGRMLWQYQVSLGGIGSPSLGTDGIIYVTGTGHNLHAIDADGKQRWKVDTNPN